MVAGAEVEFWLSLAEVGSGGSIMKGILLDGETDHSIDRYSIRRACVGYMSEATGGGRFQLASTDTLVGKTS